MPLTVAERKYRMPRGSQKEIAVELGVQQSYVTDVMNGEIFPKTERSRKRLRRTQVAIARRLRMRVDEVFPPEQSHAQAVA